MKIAIISDIKSNVYALQEVIKDIRNKDIEVVLNLGDMFYGPIEPRATYELIRENKFINILGDEDREILEASLIQLEEDDMLRYAYNDLGEEVLYWIQELSFEKIIGGTYYMIHGTYFNDKDNLLFDGEKQRSDEDIIKQTDNIEAPFIFCGNNINPAYHKLNSGQFVIAPGSIGIQKEASYSILTIEENNFGLEQIKVAYDYEKALNKAKENGVEDWFK